MANEQNLRNIGDLPPEERKAFASAGGKASVEAKRRRKLLRENMESLLALPIPEANKKMRKQMEALGISEDDMTNQMMTAIAMLKEAGNGNVKAFIAIRDLVGEKPTEKHAVEVDTGLLDDIMQQLDED